MFNISSICYQNSEQSYIQGQNWVLSRALDDKDYKGVRNYWNKNKQRQEWRESATSRNYWSDISTL